MLRLLFPLLIAHLTYYLWRLSQARDQSRDVKGDRITDPAILNVARKLADAGGLDVIETVMLDDAEVFSRMLPDGRVGLSRGMVMLKMRGVMSAEELGAVIATELGRNALGICKRRFWDFLVEESAFPRFFRGPAPVIALATNLATRMFFAVRIAERRRKAAFDADMWASALLIRSGFGVGVQKSALIALSQIQPAAEIDEITEPFAPLPNTAERIAAIEANEARWLG